MPLRPAAIHDGTLTGLSPLLYSWISPLGVILPTADVRPMSVNQTFPSPPSAIWNGSLWEFRPVLKLVIVPDGVILPIAEFAPSSVNHASPFNPDVIHTGESPAAMPQYSVIAPDELILPIAGEPSSVNHMLFPPAPRTISTGPGRIPSEPPQLVSPALYSVISPDGVILPTAADPARFSPTSVNQRLPLAPRAI